MSKNDPYFEVRAEVESSLLSAAALHSSYNRILLTLPPESRPTSEELSSTRTELKATLSTLIYDISELDHVVRVLEQDLSPSSSSSPTSSKKNNHLNKSKFGVSLDEVKKRRAWLVEVQQQVQAMKETVEMPLGSNPVPSSYHPLLPSPISPTDRKSGGRTASRSQSRNHEDRQKRSRNPAESRPQFRDDLESQREAQDDTEEFYHQQESMIMKQQDQTLGTISGVVGVLREQASLMGQEMSEQNVMLDELDGQIDHTESRLSKANRKLNRFVEENKNSKSSWTILILIIILTILLIAIVLT
ncbi:hypothetical protein PGT21_002781 [Puccinia graminis f. sp. tritici]|uniref:t-SNARE affecting a late Golgi compartment protein 1 n=2 Tax=Puccinia graminis f. sp. tritici TaxID=56615 RepID=E3JY47_PUCGT|nr:uncharacterized protein PGTG_02433 [Puccinia graminis f. sp. tritici CRL 75-36-700-3]EFP76972.2 hypothetical protein PGTG_02433 [Puccinia graminis f. sp. tritici CRL 75-36-700-3]KAA1118706.1 hypothetical protein PGT21_002781 [Puccinia graminis f. sp. tritici]KAA1135298.1 hypothetical protein PGTUg99_004848 [Puccinia graminis f. sp. tritici]